MSVTITQKTAEGNTVSIISTDSIQQESASNNMKEICRNVLEFINVHVDYLYDVAVFFKCKKGNKTKTKQNNKQKHQKTGAISSE